MRWPPRSAVSQGTRFRALFRRVALLPCATRRKAQPKSELRNAFASCSRRIASWIGSMVEDLCARRGLPQPRRAAGPAATLWAVRSIRGWWRRRARTARPAELAPLLAADRCFGGGSDVELVPVAVFWGRAPQRENSLIELFFSEDWADSRKIAAVLHATRARPRRALEDRRADRSCTIARRAKRRSKLLARKVGRLLRVFFQEQRARDRGPRSIASATCCSTRCSTVGS